MSLDRWILWFISLFCGIFCLADLLANGSYCFGIWRMSKKLDKMEQEIGTKIPLFCDDTLFLRVTNTETFDKVEKVAVDDGRKNIKEFILKEEQDV